MKLLYLKFLSKNRNYCGKNIKKLIIFELRTNNQNTLFLKFYLIVKDL